MKQRIIIDINKFSGTSIAREEGSSTRVSASGSNPVEALERLLAAFRTPETFSDLKTCQPEMARPRVGGKIIAFRPR